MMVTLSLLGRWRDQFAVWCCYSYEKVKEKIFFYCTIVISGLDIKLLYPLALGPVDLKSYWPPKKLLARML